MYFKCRGDVGNIFIIMEICVTISQFLMYYFFVFVTIYQIRNPRFYFYLEICRSKKIERFEKLSN